MLISHSYKSGLALGGISYLAQLDGVVESSGKNAVSAKYTQRNGYVKIAPRNYYVKITLILCKLIHMV